MNETQRLLSIALAVIALDGCRGASTQQARFPNASPTPYTRSAYGGHVGGGHYGSAAAAGALIGGARGNGQRRPSAWSRFWARHGFFRGNRGYSGGTYSRTLGGRSYGGFGHSGFHGGG